MAEARMISDLIEERFGLLTRAGRAMPAEGTVAQILAHRVQRRYKPDPISDEVLEIVLAAALSTPSKSDLQQVGIVIVRDRAKQALIGSWIPRTRGASRAGRELYPIEFGTASQPTGPRWR